ncbi:hypothetical protein MK372_05880, partial [Streptococcus oralis]
TVI